MTLVQHRTPLVGSRPAVTPALGDRVGLIGGSHGDAVFLRSAAGILARRGCTSLVQLGDFGMIWRGTRAESVALNQLNQSLKQVGLALHVVLGNDENHDLINMLPTDRLGVRHVFSNIRLLPRSGVVLAGRGGAYDPVHVIGWLSGAASADRSLRQPGVNWWPDELTTDDQARALLETPVSPDVVFAHEALVTPGLQARLDDQGPWDPHDLAYAEAARHEHTERVLSVLDPTKETLLVSSHHPFRHSEQATVQRWSTDSHPERLRVRQEVLDREWMPGALAVLDLSGPLPHLEVLQ